MKAQFKAATYLASSLALALTLSSPAFAQAAAMSGPAVPVAGQFMEKVIAENAKVRVTDTISHPGDTAPMMKRPMRVGHVISSGTLERTYEDGSKEVVHEVAGTTKIIDVPRPYSLKNIGKTTTHIVIVSLK